MKTFITDLSFALCRDVFQLNDFNYEKKGYISTRAVYNDDGSFEIYTTETDNSKISKAIIVSLSEIDDAIKNNFSDKDNTIQDNAILKKIEDFLNSLETNKFKTVEKVKSNEDFKKYCTSIMKILFINLKDTIKSIKDSMKDAKAEDNSNLLYESFASAHAVLIYMLQFRLCLKNYNIWVGLDKSNFLLINLKDKFGNDFDKYKVLDSIKKYKGFFDLYIEMYNSYVEEFDAIKELIDIVEKSGKKFNSLINKRNGFYYITNDFKNYIEENSISFADIKTDKNYLGFLKKARTEIENKQK